MVLRGLSTSATPAHSLKTQPRSCCVKAATTKFTKVAKTLTGGLIFVRNVKKKSASAIVPVVSSSSVRLAAKVFTTKEPGKGIRLRTSASLTNLKTGRRCPSKLSLVPNSWSQRKIFWSLRTSLKVSFFFYFRGERTRRHAPRSLQRAAGAYFCTSRLSFWHRMSSWLDS